MVLSTGIGNGPTFVIRTLKNPLLKLRVDFSCLKTHAYIQFLSFHICDFYSLPLNRQALVYRFTAYLTHMQKKKNHKNGIHGLQSFIQGLYHIQNN